MIPLPIELESNPCLKFLFRLCLPKTVFNQFIKSII